METKHTPLPWSLNVPGKPCRPYLIADTSNGKATHRCGVAFGKPTGGQGWPAFSEGFYTVEQAEANGEFIVRACNSYYDLLNALKELLKTCESDDVQEYGERPSSIAMNNARAAIKQAEQEAVDE